MFLQMVLDGGGRAAVIPVDPGPAPGGTSPDGVRGRTAAGREDHVIRDRHPWILVEVKHADTKPSASLAYYAEQLKTPHALQVVIDLPYEPADCFSVHGPVVVPARTFLSQLP
jgi:hypothetical protein